MVKLYKKAIENNKNNHSCDCTAGWTNDDTCFVITMCRNDTRNNDYCEFKLHVPVDNIIINVYNRKYNVLTNYENAAAMAVNNIISTIPINSFMMIARIKSECVVSLSNIGQCSYNTRHYFELALKVNKVRELMQILTEFLDPNPVIVLVYLIPAFIFPNNKIANKIRNKMRNDTIINTKWQPNFNVNPAEKAWNAQDTGSIIDMAKTITSELDDIRSNLFSTIEATADDALDNYKQLYKERRDSRADEIISTYTENSNFENCPPVWWPRRLLDVKMNALIPGENAWYFRGSFNTLSYTWDVGELFENIKPWFSNQGVFTNKKDAYIELLEIAKDVDISEFLWIDALCIDQGNESEKIAEVIRSPKYYKMCNKCIVMPAGLSQMPYLEELKSPILPRWFHRAWTLQEAASAEFIVGVFKDGYKDRYEIVEYLDYNINQSGVIIDSARHIMRREAINRLSASTVLEWALVRDAGRIQDVIYGILSILNITLTIRYNMCIQCIILELAGALSGNNRTAITALAGKGWLPMLMRNNDLAGIVVVSDQQSEILKDNSLLIKDTTVLEIRTLKFHKKIVDYNDDYKRYSTYSNKRYEIEKIAKRCSKIMADKNVAADNAVMRAWIARTYISARVLEIMHNDGIMVARVIMLDTDIFSHLIFIGYAENSLYIEKVYICATVVNGIFSKVGIIAQPVGNKDLDNANKTDAIIAYNCLCDCSNMEANVS